MNPSDILVVGSGPSGVLAAEHLLRHGRDVLMLDAGELGDPYASVVPSQSFGDLRRGDERQHRYLLGMDYEGIGLGDTGPLAQLTSTRQRVIRRAAELLPTATNGFAAIESLEQGGLGEAWGAVSFPFTDAELRRCGLEPGEMSRHYESVATIIGVSGEADDLQPWRGALAALQPAIEPDPNARAILSRYQRCRGRLQGRGLRVGRPLLAMLSKPLGHRARNPEYGLDFWNNCGGSVFRPSVMLPTLLTRSNFSYRQGVLVTSFRDDGEFVTVIGLDLATRAGVTFRARHLMLAAGTLGTTRIVLRSLDRYDAEVPIVCNAHAYIPSIRLRGIGAPPPEKAHALAQLTAMYDPAGDQAPIAQAQFYSFTGLPLVRLLRESPLAYRESIRIFQTLATSFVTLVAQYEDSPTSSKRCALRRGSSAEHDVLEIRYHESLSEVGAQQQADRAFKAGLRILGCFPLKVVHPGAGSSVHYGGTLPFSSSEAPLTLTPDGRLRETRRVYVADGAGLTYLPAKGPTLTLMANAQRVADGIVRRGE